MPPTPGLVLVLLQGCADRYAAEGRPLQLAFCVIPDRGNSTYLYPAIKRWANTGGGVPSQCVQAGKLLDRQKFGVTYVSNLLLKLNLKLGGQNVHPSPTGCSYAAPPRTGSSTPRTSRSAQVTALPPPKQTAAHTCSRPHHAGNQQAGAGDADDRLRCRRLPRAARHRPTLVRGRLRQHGPQPRDVPHARRLAAVAVRAGPLPPLWPSG